MSGTTDSINGSAEEIPSYRRYKIVEALDNLVKKVPSRDQYELHNILERYLVTTYPNLESDEASAAMKKQLAEKRLPAKFHDDVLKVIKNPPKYAKGNLKITHLLDSVKVSYGSFNKTIPKYRYELLSEHGSPQDILNCMFEYYSLLPSSQQWAIPLAEYKKFVADADEVVEGFASPFNSQIMRLAADFPDKKLNFCSLSECDKQFGSLGNFFDQDFTGKTVIVNPPFIESILESAAKKCLETLDKGEAKFIFYGPAWYDSPFYELLDSDETKQKYNVTKRNLMKYQYSYEDLLNDKTIKATFNSVVFEISNK